MLKLKFRALHEKVVKSVSAVDVMDFLFQERVLGVNDNNRLQSEPVRYQQSRNLLMLLHDSENPQAFVKLYCAIKKESHMQWLIEEIDKYSDQSVIDLQLSQQRRNSNPTTGECLKYTTVNRENVAAHL